MHHWPPRSMAVQCHRLNFLLFCMVADLCQLIAAEHKPWRMAAFGTANDLIHFSRITGHGPANQRSTTGSCQWFSAAWLSLVIDCAPLSLLSGMFHESIPLATLLTGKFYDNFLLGLRVRRGTLSRAVFKSNSIWNRDLKSNDLDLWLIRLASCEETFQVMCSHISGRMDWSALNKH